MDSERAGWQMIGLAVGLLVLVIACCSLGLLVGGVVGFSLGRASVRPEPTPEWQIAPPARHPDSRGTSISGRPLYDAPARSGNRGGHPR